MSDTKQAAKKSFMDQLFKSRSSGRGANAAKNIEDYKRKKAQKEKGE